MESMQIGEKTVEMRAFRSVEFVSLNRRPVREMEGVRDSNL